MVTDAETRGIFPEKESAGKTVQTAGEITLSIIDANRLEVKGEHNLCTLIAIDGASTVLLMYHPMTGWYVEKSHHRAQQQEAGNEEV